MMKFQQIICFYLKLDKELKNIKNLPFDVNSLAFSKAFDDTTKIFDPPEKTDKQIKSFLNDEEIKKIADELINIQNIVAPKILTLSPSTPRTKRPR